MYKMIPENVYCSRCGAIAVDTGEGLEDGGSGTFTGLGGELFRCPRCGAEMVVA